MTSSSPDSSPLQERSPRPEGSEKSSSKRSIPSNIGVLVPLAVIGLGVLGAGVVLYGHARFENSVNRDEPLFVEGLWAEALVATLPILVAMIGLVVLQLVGVRRQGNG